MNFYEQLLLDKTGIIGCAEALGAVNPKFKEDRENTGCISVGCRTKSVRVIMHGHCKFILCIK